MYNKYIYDIYIHIYISVAAAGLLKRGSSFLAYIKIVVNLFIPQFGPPFLFKKMVCDPVVPSRRLFQGLDHCPLNGQQS